MTGLLLRRCSRIILSMLGELKRYCPNKKEGCDWTGELNHVKTHSKASPAPAPLHVPVVTSPR